jgi:hypothetical protein
MISDKSQKNVKISYNTGKMCLVIISRLITFLQHFQIHIDHHACQHYSTSTVHHKLCPYFASHWHNNNTSTPWKKMYTSHCAHYSPPHTAGTYNIFRIYNLIHIYMYVCVFCCTLQYTHTILMSACRLSSSHALKLKTVYELNKSM